MVKTYSVKLLYGETIVVETISCYSRNMFHIILMVKTITCFQVVTHLDLVYL